jgi:hypothetical protein
MPSAPFRDPARAEALCPLAIALGLAVTIGCAKVERDWPSEATAGRAGGAAGNAGSAGLGGSQSLGGIGGDGATSGGGAGGGGGRGGMAGGGMAGGGAATGGAAQAGACSMGAAGAGGGVTCSPTCPLRVNFAAGPGGDGRTWPAAVADLQAAVEQQWTAGGGEVWVLGGTLAATASLQVPLRMRAGVSIYGGFRGT